MQKVGLMLAVSIFALGAALNAWAADPCKTIALECMAEGYFKGGDRVGKDLFKSCVIPVVSQKKTLHHASFSSDELQQCKSALKEAQVVAMD